MKVLRRAVFALALLAGCYDPSLGTPGFYCHPNDVPACPDGQVCDPTLNRCVLPGHSRSYDAGHNNPGSDGGVLPLPDSGSPGGQDSGQPPPPPPPPGQDGCRGYATCEAGCQDQTCLDMCDQNVTSQGKMLFDTGLGCGQEWCLGPNDPNGTSSNPQAYCDIDSTGTMLTDPQGAPSGTCDQCLNEALAGLFGQSCDTSDPNCDPPDCTSDFSACQADTP